ncbi:hypothetical protein [Streptococcus thoraltensis]|uniref:hypothetical protein n=1 Tax=Streptococcus thoraltensis TaxID=55085 RepID=UPI001F59171A|nr:hypothetical protein [Streptococcus thoraltensis]
MRKKKITLHDYLEAIEVIGDVDELLVRAVSAIPNRYFYGYHINLKRSQLMRREMHQLSQKLNSIAYRNDRRTRQSFRKLQKTYSDYLDACVWQDKSDLILDYLYLDQETKLDFLYDCISQYRLLKHLLGDVEDYMRQRQFDYRG